MIAFDAKARTDVLFSAPISVQRGRLMEIRDNNLDRIAETERDWLGEIEELKVSLAGAEGKLALGCGWPAVAPTGRELCSITAR